MNALRRLVLSFACVLALLLGQQAVLWHDVGHLGKHAPSQQDCETHSLCAQLGGALVGDAAKLEPLRLTHAAPRYAEQPGATLAPRRSFLSRAPPRAA